MEIKWMMIGFAVMALAFSLPMAVKEWQKGAVEVARAQAGCSK